MALTVEQQRLLADYKAAHGTECAGLSDAQIISILINDGNIQLTEAQMQSLFLKKTQECDCTGLLVEHQNDNEQEENVSTSKENYPYLAKLQEQEEKLKKVQNEQGFIGKAWNWFKNRTGIGDGSNKALEQINNERELLQQAAEQNFTEEFKQKFKEITGEDFSEENLEKFKKGELSKVDEKINDYTESQDMAADVAGDIISGIAAVGIYTVAVAAAPFTGGLSIAAGVAAATVSGAAIKSGVKALDTVGTERKYTSFGHDCATGAFSGLLAPITGGLGGAAGKAVATRFGVQVVKQVGKEVAEEVAETGTKQGLKIALTNPTGYEYVGGKLINRAVAMGAEMATDGALGGAIDGSFRAGLDSEGDVGETVSGFVEGCIGGLFMAPLIGGGMKLAGKGAQKMFGKENVKIDADGKVLDDTPDVNTDKNFTKSHLEQIETEIKSTSSEAPTTKINQKVKNEISEEFDKLKQKYQIDRNLAMNYSDEAKQTLLEIADTDADIAKLLLKREPLMFNLIQVKKAMRLNQILAKQVLEIHYPKSFIDTIKGEKTQYPLFIGDDILRIVTALNSAPGTFDSILSMKNIHKKEIALKYIGELVDDYGPEFIVKNYSDLDINAKHKLLQGLMQERGRSGRAMTSMGPEVQELFPAIPRCVTKDEHGNSVNTDYINTIKALYHDIYGTDLNLDSKIISSFNSSLDKTLKTKTDASINTFVNSFVDIFDKLHIKLSADNIKNSIQEISKHPNFSKFSEEEQKVLLLCSALKNDNTQGIRAISKNILQQLGISENSIKRYDSILSAQEIIYELDHTTNPDELDYLHFRLAFELKNTNCLEMSDTFYNLSQNSHIDYSKIKSNVKYIKSTSFSLPQSTMDDYMQVATMQNIQIGETTYRVPVLNITQLKNFNSYTHSLEGTSSGDHLKLNLETILKKYKLFHKVSKDNKFCVSYINEKNIGVLPDGIGLLFEVPNDMQYVGAGYDIGSLSRDTRSLIENYFCNGGKIQEKVGWGKHENVNGAYLQQIVSKNLKEILDITDDEYIARWDNIYSNLDGDEVLTFAKLKELDSKMYEGFRTFFAKSNNAQEFKDDCILRNCRNMNVYKEVWNEFLVSSPKISGIYINSSTIDISTNLVPWLKFSEENNIPIIFLKTPAL